MLLKRESPSVKLWTMDIDYQKKQLKIISISELQSKEMNIQENRSSSLNQTQRLVRRYINSMLRLTGTTRLVSRSKETMFGISIPMTTDSEKKFLQYQMKLIKL